MATGYIGNNNVASKVNNIYVGVNNVARKVSKAYVGVNNVAKLAYTSDAPTNFLVFTAVNGGSTLSMTATGYGTTYTLPELQYSLDKGKWTDFIPGVTIITFPNAGSSVRMCAKSTNASISYANAYSTFTGEGNVRCSGNVMSLLDKTGLIDSIQNEYCFYKLFENFTNLLSAPELPCLNLSSNCYANMFYGCSNLLTAMALPATDLKEHCYENMFYGCSSLSTAPLLPATVLKEYCYSNMFYGTSIIETPELLATDVPAYAYRGMFESCTSLTTINALGVTKLSGEACMSRMFYGCTGVTTSPTMSFTNIPSNGLSYMFYKCKIRDGSVITISGEISYSGCAYMFADTYLTKCAIFDGITSIGVNGCGYMYQDCSLLKTIPDLSCASISSFCYQNMFYYCSALETVPDELPALDVPQYAYYCMFMNCNKITKTPKILATSVAECSMAMMFEGCTSLKTISSPLKAAHVTYWCYMNMFKGCKALTQIPAIYATEYDVDATVGATKYSYAFNGMLDNSGVIFMSEASTSYPNKFRIPMTGTGTPDIMLKIVWNNFYANTTVYTNVEVVTD